MSSFLVNQLTLLYTFIQSEEEMKVAVLLKNNDKNEVSDTFRILLLIVEGNQILKAYEEYLPSREINYLSLWLLSQRVSVIYVQETNEETRAYYRKLNIEVKTYEDLLEYPLFAQFFF